jgi:uncharacterized membrane protein YkvA (DUF1232 family)
MTILTQLRSRARDLKAETFALYLAARHSATPWYAKLMVAAIVAYALSPIDLIPDFVPILGYVDDLILIPLGITLAIKMIPPAVMSECRPRAREVIANGKPVSRVAGAVIVLIWLTLVVLLAICTYAAFASDGRAPYGQAEVEHRLSVLPPRAHRIILPIHGAAPEGSSEIGLC